MGPKQKTTPETARGQTENPQPYGQTADAKDTHAKTMAGLKSPKIATPRPKIKKTTQRKTKLSSKAQQPISAKKENAPTMKKPQTEEKPIGKPAITLPTTDEGPGE